MIWWRVPCGGYVYVPDANELRHLPPHAAQAARLFMEGRSRELLAMSDPLARSLARLWYSAIRPMGACRICWE